LLQELPQFRLEVVDQKSFHDDDKYKCGHELCINHMDTAENSGETDCLLIPGYGALN
jgi:hypothetical protein